MDILEAKRRERDEAFDQFLKHAALETKHSVSARKWRHLHLLAADEVRAMERDMLALPVSR